MSKSLYSALEVKSMFLKSKSKSVKDALEVNHILQNVTFSSILEYINLMFLNVKNIFANVKH